MRLIDADACPKLFNKEFKETMRLISQGETHLDNLAEGFTEAHRVIQSIHTADAADVLRSQWISVTDGLPESEEEVLVLTVSKTGNVNVDKGYLLNGRFVHRGSAVVTHWMPLPEMPEEIQNA